jgi:hypothetical protein
LNNARPPLWKSLAYVSVSSFTSSSAAVQLKAERTSELDYATTKSSFSLVAPKKEVRSERNCSTIFTGYRVTSRKKGIVKHDPTRLINQLTARKRKKENVVKLSIIFAKQ